MRIDPSVSSYGNSHKMVSNGHCSFTPLKYYFNYKINAYATNSNNTSTITNGVLTGKIFKQ